MAEDKVSLAILINNENIPTEIFSSSVDKYFGPQMEDFSKSCLVLCILSEATGLEPSQENVATYIKSQWLLMTTFKEEEDFQFKVVICDNRNWNIMANEEETETREIHTSHIECDKTFLIRITWNKPMTFSIESLSDLYSMDESFIKSYYESHEISGYDVNHQEFLDSAQNLQTIKEDVDDTESLVDSLQEPVKEDEKYEFSESEDSLQDKVVKEDSNENICGNDSLINSQSNETVVLNNEDTDERIKENSDNLDSKDNTKTKTDEDLLKERKEIRLLKIQSIMGIKSELQNIKLIDFENMKKEKEKENCSEKNIEYNENEITLNVEEEESNITSSMVTETLQYDDVSTFDADSTQRCDSVMYIEPISMAFTQEPLISLNDRRETSIEEKVEQLESVERNSSEMSENNKDNESIDIDKEQSIDNKIEERVGEIEDREEINEIKEMEELLEIEETKEIKVREESKEMNELKELDDKEMIKEGEENQESKDTRKTESKNIDKTEVLEIIEENENINKIKVREIIEENEDINETEVREIIEEMLELQSEEEINVVETEKIKLNDDKDEVEEMLKINKSKNIVENYTMEEIFEIEENKENFEEETKDKTNEIEYCDTKENINLNISNIVTEKDVTEIRNQCIDNEEKSPTDSSANEDVKESLHSDNNDDETELLHKLEDNDDKDSELNTCHSVKNDQSYKKNENLVQENDKIAPECITQTYKGNQEMIHNKDYCLDVETKDNVVSSLNITMKEDEPENDIENEMKDCEELQSPLKITTSDSSIDRIDQQIYDFSLENNNVKLENTQENETSLRNDDIEPEINIDRVMDNEMVNEETDVCLEENKSFEEEETIITSQPNVETVVEMFEKLGSSEEEPQRLSKSYKIENFDLAVLKQKFEVEHKECENKTTLEDQKKDTVDLERNLDSFNLNYENISNPTQEEPKVKKMERVDDVSFNELNIDKKTSIKKENNENSFESTNINVINNGSTEVISSPTCENKENETFINTTDKVSAKKLSLTHREHKLDIKEINDLGTHLTVKEIKKILNEKRDKLAINDDYKYPDSVTPTKVEHHLSQSPEYNVPFMDDDSFYKENWYEESDDRWTSLDRTVIENKEKQVLSPATEASIKLSPKASTETLKEPEDNKLKISDVPITKSPKKKGLISLCGCVRGK